MNDIEKMVQEVERRYQEEVKKQEEALNEKALADEMKEEAIRKEKAAKAALKELENARNYAAKAQESYNAFKESTEKTNSTTENNEVKVVEEKQEEVKTEENKSNGFVKGLVIGATTIALVATGAWALSRDSKTGEIRAMSWFKRDENKGNNDEAIIETAEPAFVYDYENNVVTVKSQVDPRATYAYDFEAKASEDTSYVDVNGNPIPVVTEAGQAITNPIVNEELPSNLPYVELTTEKFEELTTNLIQKYENIGLQVSREDVIKYVMIRNIDKLRQDNPELITQLVGSQDIFEFITDACHVLDAMRNYNLLYFDKYHTTDGFVSAVDGVFDEVQKARATELERRVYEIGTYYQDDVKYNELVYTLLRDLYNPLNPISQLEDGVSYGMESVDVYMLRTRFSQDVTGRLNETNTDLIKYFVSFPEDEDKYTDNALMNGNVTNIIRLLQECNVKTRTK